MSWLSSFLHPERGYDEAQNTLNKYYNEGQGYSQPYNQNGINAGGVLNNAIGKLTNPGAFYDELMKTYDTSEAAKNSMGQAKEQGLDAASAMGLMGSTPAIQAIQAGTSQIGAQDKQNYLQNLINMYNQGTNLAGNMYGIGANTAGQMNTNAQNMGQNSAGLQFGKTNAPGQMFGNLVNAGLNLGTSYLTGGMGKGGFGRGAWSPTGG